jgi:hypothetical protein
MRAAARLGALGKSGLIIAFMFFLRVSPFIDRRNLSYPPLALAVLQVQNCVFGPVKVVSHEGYLLVQRLEGVA